MKNILYIMPLSMLLFSNVINAQSFYMEKGFNSVSTLNYSNTDAVFENSETVMMPQLSSEIGIRYPYSEKTILSIGLTNNAFSVCGGDNTYNFHGQDKVLCYDVFNNIIDYNYSWSYHGVYHTISYYPISENPKTITYDINGCTYNEEIEIKWKIPAQGYDCNDNLTAEVGDYIQGGMVYEVNGNSASIVYTGNDITDFASYDTIYNYCDSLTTQWGDGNFYSWYLSDDNVLVDLPYDSNPSATLEYNVPSNQGSYNAYDVMYTQCIRQSSPNNYTFYGE